MEVNRLEHNDTDASKLSDITWYWVKLRNKYRVGIAMRVVEGGGVKVLDRTNQVV